MFMVISALVVDVMLSISFDALGKELASHWGLALFTTLIVAIYGIGQYFILEFVRRSNIYTETKAYTSAKGDRITTAGTNTTIIPTIKKTNASLQVAHNIIKIVQYVLAIILFITVIQIIFFSYYDLALVIAATVVSYIPAAVIMSIFTYKLFSWYIYGRKSFTVLLYGVAIGLAVVSIICNVISFNGIMIIHIHDNIHKIHPTLISREETIKL